MKLTMTDEQRDGQSVSVLSMGQQELGYVRPDGDRFVAVVSAGAETDRFRNEDDAVNFLIATFHLHQH
ncbi:hypothetical protein FD19_GL000149 [Lacticaseibacillus thailandensis DSM 22698 = JCM 13996]|uniref:DUF2969 domain-containing protein n=1 Tax=Lacticaseibacillus thailandensis DSM 22698 = JCM 13996 TaxID=1423810 RepID=A0A0R2C942_9LACO|nr:hypothetical protein FD19_GL000149 [Lacticaseibacillus thailandensis DSM 22698 = JCM 13996]